MRNATIEILLTTNNAITIMKNALITCCQHYQIPRCRIRSCQTLGLTCFIL